MRFESKKCDGALSGALVVTGSSERKYMVSVYYNVCVLSWVRFFFPG